MQWYERNPQRMEVEHLIGKSVLEDCRTGVGEDGLAYMEGLFHVRSRHGHRYESVMLRVQYPAGFPGRGITPKVVLLSHHGGWRRGGNSHINDDWSLCLFVPVESEIDFDREDSLNAFFAVVHSFLFKEHVYQQALVREALGGEKAVWPGEARAHGLAGVNQAIQERGRIGRNEFCPCGSGNKFKSCCMRRLRR